MISVRPAQPGDGAALVQMAHALAVSHGTANTFALTADGLEHDLFRPDAVIGALLALVDGVPAGSAVWHRSYSTNRGREVMYLEDLSVLEPFRRRGVARALVQAAAKVAVARGYPAMFWNMMDWNDGARILYAALGADIEPGYAVCRLKDEALRRVAQ